MACWGKWLNIKTSQHKEGRTWSYMALGYFHWSFFEQRLFNSILGMHHIPRYLQKSQRSERMALASVCGYTPIRCNVKFCFTKENWFPSGQGWERRRMSWREVFMVETTSSIMWALSKFWPALTFSSFKLSLVHPNLAGLPHTASLFSPSNQLGQGPRGWSGWPGHYLLDCHIPSSRDF